VKRLWASFSLLVLVVTPANAKDFQRTAAAGQATKMIDYKGWDPKTCRPKMGVVKVVNKPNHGTISTRNVQGEIGVGRSGYARCKGTPITAFRVEYTSNPGFRGVAKLHRYVHSERSLTRG
jgi:hypothetical protein